MTRRVNPIVLLGLIITRIFSIGILASTRLKEGRYRCGRGPGGQALSRYGLAA